MRDIQEIKQHVNQLIQEQTKQQETLVHVIFILNITRYAVQVNRQKLNEISDALQRSNEDLKGCLTLQRFWHNALAKMHIYMHTILAYLGDCLTYMR